MLNAANEVAVHAFLGGRIAFPRIAEVIEAALDELGAEPAARVRGALRGGSRGARGSRAGAVGGRWIVGRTCRILGGRRLMDHRCGSASSTRRITRRGRTRRSRSSATSSSPSTPTCSGSTSSGSASTTPAGSS